MTINLISLGCSKNLVDSEKLIFQFERNGHRVVHNSDENTDAVIINTCGFILDAKTESIETILSYIELKKRGFISKLIVFGCLSERYKSSLEKEMPEVDGFYGVNDHEKIMASLEARYYAGELYKRSLQTPGHYAYLKISEGCNRNCSFCAIPGIRGKQRSIEIPQLIREAEELASKGVKEIILIAQELSSYGTDIYGRRALPGLLEELVKIESFEWIRLHYFYPSGFPADEILSLMQKHRKICRYLDMPVQHISDKILSAMNRGHDSSDIREILGKFRESFDEIAIRTTLITGFPGEGPKEFRELIDFVKDTGFDRLGVFGYSHEEDTPAYSKFSDQVKDSTKNSRKEKIMEVQQRISLEKNLARIGREYKVIIDGREGEFYIARTEFDSPEVDNEVLIPADGISLKRGEFCLVKIFDATEFDLYGQPVGNQKP